MKLEIWVFWKKGNSKLFSMKPHFARFFINVFNHGKHIYQFYYLHIFRPNDYKIFPKIRLCSKLMENSNYHGHCFIIIRQHISSKMSQTKNKNVKIYLQL